MSKLMVPAGYRQKLSIYETQTAIAQIKKIFEDSLSEALNLKRVSAPLFVQPQTGLNDDLNGIERPVEFDIKETETKANLHSIYVDQWDWEKVIDRNSRNEEFLRKTVIAIVNAGHAINKS